MATPAQIAANRRNALKSTGPRTAAGKAASSRNALRHGLAARSAVVLGEDPADLARFRAELMAALAPRDGREEFLAEVAAAAAWRLRRVWRAEAALFNRAGRCAPSCLRELLVLQHYEVAANRRFHRAIAMLEQGRTLEHGSAKQAMFPHESRPSESSYLCLSHGCPDRASIQRQRLSLCAQSPHCRHGRTCSGHPRVFWPPTNTWMRGTSPRMTIQRGDGCEEAQPDWRRRTAVCLSRASAFSSAAKEYRSEQRRRNTAAPGRAARNRRFCRRNPIWGPSAGTQELGVSGTLSLRSSRLAFAEKQLISWKTVLKRHRVKQNPFEFASIWPSWAERRAPPPQLQQIALQ
jgi:hypothetical protein